MPFDPKLIRPDEPLLGPEGELQLPDDLRALAEELGDDAARLAKCFPPPRPTNRPAPLVGTSGRRVAAAAAVVGSSALALLLVVGFMLRPIPVHVAIQAKQQEQMAHSSPADKSIAPDTTVSLVDLSGPELEALLDLMERDSHSTASVSF